MKQGCPLSPVLFNLCIDALVRRLNAQSLDGLHIGEHTLCAQAYADDLVLISDSERGMKNLISTVERFCNYTNMKVQTQKCRSLSYINHHDERNTTGAQFKLNDSFIPIVPIRGGTTFLGIMTSLQKSFRAKTANIRIEKAIEMVGLICSSPLKLNQMLDAIRRFIIPSLDYEFLNGTCNSAYRDRLNRTIRSAFDSAMNTMSLPVHFFYTAWKDGGAGIKDINERHDCLVITAFCNMWFSKDETLRKIFRLFCREEKSLRYRLVDEPDSQIFANIDDHLRTDYPGTSNLFSRVISVLKRTHFSLKLNDPKVSITLPRGNTIDVNLNSLLDGLNNYFCEEHYSKLIAGPFRGHTFKTLKSNKLSNYFISQYSSKLSNDTIRFAIASRTNSFFTGQFANLTNNHQLNSRCNVCGELDSLRHRLNDCKSSLAKFKNRHDSVVREIVELIKANPGRRPIIHLDSTVRKPNGDAIDGPHASDRPDIWFETQSRYVIVEVTVPYGDVSEDGRNSLEERYNGKEQKYKDLITDITNQTGKEATLFTIVISSLGAWYHKSLKALKLIANAKDRFKRFSKRIVVAVLKESHRLLNSNSQLSSETDHSDEIDTEDVEHDNRGDAEPVDDALIVDSLDTEDGDPCREDENEDHDGDVVDAVRDELHRLFHIDSDDDAPHGSHSRPDTEPGPIVH